MKRLFTADAYVSSILDITPEGLKKRGIYGLILDIDNTLVATNIKDPGSKIINYIKKLNDAGIKTIIVSNAGKKRVEVFCTHLNIDYIYKAKKPLGNGFLKAIDKMGLPKEKVAIVGDQLFTDVLGGNLIGIHTILIKPIDLKEPIPILLKRILEKPFLIKRHYTDKF